MSKRTEQVAELLRSNINQIIIKDFEAPKGTLVSVSEVTVSPDLKNATCLISIIPNNRIGSGMEAIKKFAGHAQRELAKQMAIRTTPRIHFTLDERDLKYKAIDEALNQ